jgi:hypothetical protein
MSPKRILAFTAMAVLVVFSAEAQKRRAVRSAPPQAAVIGDCHTFGLVRAGLIADYLSNAQGGDVTFTITYISDTPTQVKTKQRVVTPQATTDVETTVDGEVVGNLRGIKHIKTKGTTSVPGFGNLALEVDIDFVPSLIAGPAAGWCIGAKWTTAPVTETIVSKTAAGNFTNVVTTVASEGEVLAVDEEVEVIGGKFRTVKYRGNIVSGDVVSPAFTWVSKEHNIVVKQDTLDAAGNVTSRTQVTRVQ